MIATWFLRCGAATAILGMGLGIYMAASQDHRLMPVHAHVNLVGWVTMFLAGLFYVARPAAAGRLARLHLATALSGVLVLTPGIAGVHLGQSWGEPVAAIGALLTFTASVVFLVVVVRATAVARG